MGRRAGGRGAGAGWCLMGDATVNTRTQELQKCLRFECIANKLVGGGRGKKILLGGGRGKKILLVGGRGKKKLLGGRRGKKLLLSGGRGG